MPVHGRERRKRNRRQPPAELPDSEHTQRVKSSAALTCAAGLTPHRRKKDTSGAGNRARPLMKRYLVVTAGGISSFDTYGEAETAARLYGGDVFYVA